MEWLRQRSRPGRHPTEDGHATRAGAVIRSDNIRGLSDDGWRALADHGVVRIVDLRWPEERADDPRERRRAGRRGRPRVGPRPSLTASLAYLEELDAHVRSRTSRITTPGRTSTSWSEIEERFGAALAAIADADGPVVIHCMGGKDRTGLVAALLLRLAGVSREAIGADYALSGPNLEVYLEVLACRRAQ